MSLSRFSVGDLVTIDRSKDSIGLVIKIEKRVMTVRWFIQGKSMLVKHIRFNDIRKVENEDFAGRIGHPDC